MVTRAVRRESKMDIIQENGPLPPSPIQSPTRIGTNVSGMTERLLGSPGMLRRGSSLDSHGIPATFEAGSSWSGSSTPDRVKLQQGVAHTSSASATPNQPQSMAANVNVAWLAAIREWKNCLDALSKALQISLAETYKQYEANASPERIDQLFNDKRFRRHSIEAMRNASVYKMLSASPDFWPKYSIRFRNYERVKADLLEIRALLQAGESGISPDRRIREITIDSRGDAILEFSNFAGDGQPVFRFRVSSHMLAATSPIFSRMFTNNSDSFNLGDDEEDELMEHLPPPPAIFICGDGSETKLFRMPQYEVDEEKALSILLHAAHHHTDKIPRDISFSKFVAVASVCMRYKCTAPLELVVEHRWLPQWIHKASDGMPDGLVLITFVFGLRHLFTRLTKTVILNLKDESELQHRPWPQKIKDKIWAVRSAKMSQIQTCCQYSIEEYIRPPIADLTTIAQEDATPQALSSTTRCPKCSHACDATNLGWLLLVYNEMNMLHTVMQPGLSHRDGSQESQSLSHIIETLGRAASAPHPIHSGAACDPAPAFRSAMFDIYNSVSGLTLFDISGYRHGWALSHDKRNQPQNMHGLTNSNVSTRRVPRVGLWSLEDSLRLRLFRQFDDLSDMNAVAQICKPWYETFKANELSLMRGILRADMRKVNFNTSPRAAAVSSVSSFSCPTIEDKVLKQEMVQTGKSNNQGQEHMEYRDSEEESISISDDDDEDSMIERVEISPTTEQTTVSPSLFLETNATPLSLSSIWRPEREVANLTKLTEEELDRILYPEWLREPPNKILPTTPKIVKREESGQEGKEKFLADDCFVRGEDKSLAYHENAKKLRSEADSRLRGKEKTPCFEERNVNFHELGFTQLQRSDSSTPVAECSRAPVPKRPESV